MNKFKCEKNIELFLNLEKGKGINIKKEEIITNIDEIRREKWVGNYYFDFSIDSDDIKINFDNPTIKKFFESNYKNDMIDLAILSNKELQIKPPFKQELKLNRYPEEKITEIFAPKKIDNILKQKYKLCLTKGNYNEFNGDIITCPKCIDDYNDNIEFIQVDYNDLIFAYIIGFFNFKNDIFKTIKIPLIIKIKLTKNEFKEIIKPYVLSLSEYSESNFKNLINITNITNDLELAKHNIRGYVNKDSLSNIILLNEIYQYVKTNQDILIEYKELLKKTIIIILIL